MNKRLVGANSVEKARNKTNATGRKKLIRIRRHKPLAPFPGQSFAL